MIEAPREWLQKNNACNEAITQLETLEQALTYTINYGKKVAKKYGTLEEDIFSAWLLGMAKACKSYTNTHNTKLSSWLITKAKYAVRDFFKERKKQIIFITCADIVDLIETKSVALFKKNSLENININQHDFIKCLPNFTVRDQFILRRYFLEDADLPEIAKVLKLSPSRISQIKTKLITELKVLMLPD